MTSTMTTSQIACDRCRQETPGMPGVMDWLLTEAPDEADGKIRVSSAICPACQTPTEDAIVDAAQRGLHWIHENAGIGGPATMLGDYLSCLSTALAGSEEAQR